MISPERRAGFIQDLGEMSGVLERQAQSARLDTPALVRNTALAVSMLCDLAIEALGGDSEAPRDHPDQLHLFDEGTGPV